jgi:hypothetical protein
MHIPKHLIDRYLDRRTTHYRWEQLFKDKGYKTVTYNTISLYDNQFAPKVKERTTTHWTDNLWSYPY